MSKLTKTLAAVAVSAAALTSLTAGQASAQTAPSVVLVHGAFADAAGWDKVATILRAKGVTVTEVANPLTSLADDVAATRAVLDTQTGPVVLVGHSWGGVVIGEAGDDPKVKSLVYIAAFGLDKGESIQGISAGQPTPPGIQALRPDKDGNLLIDPAQFPTVFAEGVPADEAAKMATDQIPTNPGIFAATAVVAAWHLKPTYYAVSADDQMIPAQAEAFFAQRMKATTVTLTTGHASMVSQPDAVAALILQAVDAK